ncbi:hypothetical protein BDK51DRAFT_25508 [Blyttiomyces helicus]|uniref:Bet v1-like protein n=1 Tax=Blyttiomyces helicus TaxID=388810 RepID=A0A4P9W8B8_9FUNG|nr:hypothetical protein BDK51DRAFT_25508 [Blyttiomyces helicus]|eukprot:RKO87040.1 hypothetical protein BDK51DRAFT_25508 [Blyttiomyces helicus]
MSIQSATRVWESRVVNAPIGIVWSHVKNADFKFWSAVKSTTFEGGAAEAVQMYSIRELSDLKYFVTYEIIESNPPVATLAALHTIRLIAITHDNSTLVEWKSEYPSSDQTPAVVEDSRFKKKEALQDLVTALAK